MSSQPVKDIEAALREMEDLAKGGGKRSEAKDAGRSAKSSSGDAAKRSRRETMKPATKEAPAPQKRVNPITWLFKSVISLVVLVILPFWILIRSSMYINMEYGINMWLSVVAGMGISTLVLLVYAALLRKKFLGNWKVTGRMTRMLFLVVALYSGYSLMYFSGTNVKSDEVRSTYLSLHPGLRIATSTLVLVDRDLVVTDMGRTPDDYRRMGLPVLENSLHYKQENGYVEAVDIRTKGKSEWVNQLVRFYFWSMGFNTLRHTGTADHLHVSVPRS